MKEKNEINKSSEKSFGIIFSTVFFILAIFFYNKEILFFIIFFLISFFFLISGIFFSSLLEKPNIAWFKFGLILSKITSPIIMLVLYIFIVIPTGIFYIFLRKKQYDKKIDKNVKSYWVKRKDPLESMDNQF